MHFPPNFVVEAKRTQGISNLSCCLVPGAQQQMTSHTEFISQNVNFIKKYYGLTYF